MSRTPGRPRTEVVSAAAERLARFNKPALRHSSVPRAKILPVDSWSTHPGQKRRRMLFAQRFSSRSWAGATFRGTGTVLRAIVSTSGTESCT